MSGTAPLAPTWRGAGPAPGTFGVEPGSPSVAGLQNYYPRQGSIEYIFDPDSNTFVVGSPWEQVGSPHESLAATIGDMQAQPPANPAQAPLPVSYSGASVPPIMVASNDVPVTGVPNNVEDDSTPRLPPGTQLSLPDGSLYQAGPDGIPVLVKAGTDEAHVVPVGGSAGGPDNSSSGQVGGVDAPPIDSSAGGGSNSGSSGNPIDLGIGPLLPIITALGDRGEPGTSATYLAGAKKEAFNIGLGNIYLGMKLEFPWLHVPSAPQIPIANDELPGAAAVEGLNFLVNGLAPLLPGAISRAGAGAVLEENAAQSAARSAASSVPDAKTIVSPEMEQKILFGQRVTNSSGTLTNRIIGAHSGQISNDAADFAVETLATNPDGTSLAKLVKQFPDGAISNIKTSTLFPNSWADADILSAIQDVGSPQNAIALRVSDGSALYRSTVNGVEIEVIKIGDNVTAAYPTGGRPTNPQAFAGP